MEVDLKGLLLPRNVVNGTVEVVLDESAHHCLGNGLRIDGFHEENAVDDLVSKGLARVKKKRTLAMREVLEMAIILFHH